jgi:hypothetical protein
MTKIKWDSAGQHIFEAGIDRAVLYVDGSPGVPWVGLVNVTQSQSGGEPASRYLDGIKISHRASSEGFEGTIEAFTYPFEFERCDGTYRIENGLRLTQQRRRAFSMVYRSLIGNEIEGVDHAYKIHMLYNLRAQPSDRGYRTLSDQTEPATFSWKVSSRPEQVAGYRPTAHYVLDSRDIPAELLTQIEDLLYGTEETAPTIPTAGELVFMFDSYLDEVYDAGTPHSPVFAVYDAGTPATPVTEILDGGAL